MKTFKKLINIVEAKQVGILYHATTYDNADKILKDNVLKRGKRGFVSFSRSKIGTKIKVDKLHVVIFVINGNKLSEKYKIKPYNHSWNQNKNVDYITHQMVDEMEERVFSDITNFSQYVLSIERT